MNDKNDLIKDITDHLDKSIEAFEPEILSRIRTARYNALEKKHPGFMQWAFPAGGIAVAAIALFVAVNLFTGSENSSSPPIVVDRPIDTPEPDKENTLPVKNIEIEPDQIELVEILSSDEQLDLFENLEFYAWLAENENISG